MSSNLTNKYSDLAVSQYGYNANNVSNKTLQYQDIINATMTGFALLFAAGIISALFLVTLPEISVMVTMASSVALIGLWLFISFSSASAIKHGKTFMVLFALLEGVILGSLVSSLSMIDINGTPGNTIVGQAALATLGIFLGCLFAYRKAGVRITQGGKLQKFIYIATFGMMFIMIGNFALSMFTGNNALWGQGWLPIVFALVALVLGTLLLIDDFGQIEQAVSSGVDERYKWILSLSLLSTIIWIFVEMIRLLVSIASNRN